MPALPGSSCRRILPIVFVLAGVAQPSFLSAQGVGIIRGVVSDSQGGAVSGAQITVTGTSLRIESGPSGEFRIPRVPSGAASINVRRLGYRPATVVAQVAPGSETSVDFRLAPVPEMLPPVEVTRKAEISDRRLAGFHARKEKGVGHYVTREQLDRRDSPRFADALRQVPGLTVKPIRRGGGTTVSMRGNCPPLVFLDGFPAAAGTLDLDMIDLASVEGIEVYSGISTVPAEFYSVRGGERCGVIAIWSRPAGPRRVRLGNSSPGALEREVASAGVYTADQVQEPALLAPGSASPTFPDSLWQAGVGGRVVAEFIVSAQGVIEPGTFGIASSTHPAFSSAVRSALEGAVFRPAKLAGRNVRQLVQLPFVFDPPAAGSTEPATPF